MSRKFYEDKEYHVELGWPESFGGLHPAFAFAGSWRQPVKEQHFLRIYREKSSTVFGLSE